jgi:chromosome segregation ATPase
VPGLCLQRTAYEGTDMSCWICDKANGTCEHVPPGQVAHLGPVEAECIDLRARLAELTEERDKLSDDLLRSRDVQHDLIRDGQTAQHRIAELDGQWNGAMVALAAVRIQLDEREARIAWLTAELEADRKGDEAYRERWAELSRKDRARIAELEALLARAKGELSIAHGAYELVSKERGQAQRERDEARAERDRNATHATRAEHVAYEAQADVKRLEAFVQWCAETPRPPDEPAPSEADRVLAAFATAVAKRARAALVREREAKSGG